MKTKIKLFVIILFSISAFPNLYPQNHLRQQYESALNLFKSEKYFDAVTEFKRLIFFDYDSIYYFEANRMIAESYKMGGKFSKALNYFLQAQLSTNSKDEIFKIRIEAVKINILRRTPDAALNILNELEINEKNPEQLKEIYYWRGWAHIFADDWEKAAESFQKINPGHELAVYSLNVEEEKYSANLAKILSLFIPGAGQFYTGNYISGLLSLSWNIFWGYITVNSFIDERIFDGFMVGNFLWFRFYRGNIQNAVKFAEEENHKIINKAMNYLQYEYKGLKP